MLEEEIICLKANIIREKNAKQAADEKYKFEKGRLEQTLQNFQLKLANLKQKVEDDEDWEPMTDIAVDRWIEEENEKLEAQKHD